MAQALKNNNAIEYSVYIHHANSNKKRPSWEKASTTSDMILALEQAKMLFDSERFEKVEIKSKIFCKNSKMNIAKTLKVFSKHGPDNDKSKRLMLCGLLVASTLVLFAALNWMQ